MAVQKHKFDVEITAVARVSVTVHVEAASQEAANALIAARIKNENDDFSELDWGIDELADVEIVEEHDEEDEDCDDDEDDNDDEEEEEAEDGEDVV